MQPALFLASRSRPMAKQPDPHRLELANYPFQWRIDTAFGDMDIAGHINNVALSRYYETGRCRWLIALTGDSEVFTSGLNTIVAEYTVRFLGEISFPDQVTVGTGIGRIGNSSFSSQQALFVNGQCVGLSDSAMVLTYDGKPTQINDQLRKKMERFQTLSPQ